MVPTLSNERGVPSRTRSLVLATAFAGYSDVFSSICTLYAPTAVSSAPRGECTGVASPRFGEGCFAGDSKSEWIYRCLFCACYFFPPLAFSPCPHATVDHIGSISKSCWLGSRARLITVPSSASVQSLVVGALPSCHSECRNGRVERGMMQQFRQTEAASEIPAWRHAVCVHMPRPGYSTWHRRLRALAGHVQPSEEPIMKPEIATCTNCSLSLENGDGGVVCRFCRRHDAHTAAGNSALQNWTSRKFPQLSSSVPALARIHDIQ